MPIAAGLVGGSCAPANATGGRELCSRKCFRAGAVPAPAPKMAIETKPPLAGQLQHSDRGGHYLSKAYQALVTKHGMLVSMSRKGNCYDNAVVERFFATLKGELLYPNQIRTRKQARAMIFD